MSIQPFTHLNWILSNHDNTPRSSISNLIVRDSLAFIKTSVLLPKIMMSSTPTIAMT